MDQTPSAATVVGAITVATGLAVIGGVAWGKGERRDRDGGRDRRVHRRLHALVEKSIVSGLRIGLVATAAYGLVLLAYNRADAANVALRSTSILFGLLLVRRTVTRRLVLCALSVVGGAVLVAV